MTSKQVESDCLVLLHWDLFCHRLQQKRLLQPVQQSLSEFAEKSSHPGGGESFPGTVPFSAAESMEVVLNRGRSSTRRQSFGTYDSIRMRYNKFVDGRPFGAAAWIWSWVGDGHQIQVN